MKMLVKRLCTAATCIALPTILLFARPVGIIQQDAHKADMDRLWSNWQKENDPHVVVDVYSRWKGGTPEEEAHFAYSLSLNVDCLLNSDPEAALKMVNEEISRLERLRPTTVKSLETFLGMLYVNRAEVY